MGLYRKAAGAFGNASVYRKESGSWAQRQLYRKEGGVWVLKTAALTATPSAPSRSAIDTTATVTTASVTVTAAGGSGSYSYSWAKVSGGDVVANSPTSATTTFKSGAAMTVGEERTATMRCTVTDTATGATATCNVTVTLDRVAAPSISLNKTSLSSTDLTASETTASVTATGSSGTAPYTYHWTRVSGAGSASSTGIACDSPNAATTTFTSSSLTAGETRSATWQCTVTDANGFTATASISVTIARASALSASASPASLSGSGTTASITTASSATATASGGAGPYTYSWTKVSGGAITLVSATSASTKFKATTMANGESRTATFKCTITDSLGQTATTGNVTVTITNTASTGATYTPAPGTYSASDTGSVSYTIGASASVPWTWSFSGNNVTADVVSGDSATSITFTLNATLSADHAATVTVNSGGNSWTLNLTAWASGGGGGGSP